MTLSTPFASNHHIPPWSMSHRPRFYSICAEVFDWTEFVFGTGKRGEWNA